MYFVYYPKDILTWVLVPFLAVHFIIPHKEIRFLFPMIGFLPIMILRTAEIFLRKKGYEVMERRITKISVKIFWYLNMFMLVILIFRPADEQISLYKQLWDNYKTPVKLYYTEDHPYRRAKVDACFYKRSCLTLHHVDSLKMVKPSPDTISLVVTNKPDLQVDPQFRPVLIYTSFPEWIKHFNINNWIDRTSFWYIYELKR
jgi:phosphatidylinositol glycan class B